MEEAHRKFVVEALWRKDVRFDVVAVRSRRAEVVGE